MEKEALSCSAKLMEENYQLGGYYEALSILIEGIEKDIDPNLKSSSFNAEAKEFLTLTQKTIEDMRDPLNNLYDKCKALSKHRQSSRTDKEKMKRMTEELEQKEDQMKRMSENYEKELVSLQDQIAKLNAKVLIAEDA